MNLPPLSRAAFPFVLSITTFLSLPSAAFELGDTGATQAVVVVTSSWSSASAKGVLIEKTDGAWKALSKSLMVVGRNGLGWGRGLHPTAPTSSAPVKKEGDGKAPAGVFALGTTAYGRGAKAPTKTALDWVPASGNVCVDDVKSPQYNRIVFADKKKGNYRSAERMRRKDALYDVVVVVDHNKGAALDKSAPTPGSGSCIFLHVWRRKNKGTAGCTAMPKKNIVELLGALDPKKKPILIQLPRAEYKRLATEWKLPPLDSIEL